MVDDTLNNYKGDNTMIFFVSTLVCYFIIAAIRLTKIPNEWLPLISGSIGLTFSTIIYFACPTIMPDISIIDMLIYGFISGLAATGGNQVLKQTLQFFKNKYGISIQLPTVTSKSEDRKE